MSSMKQPCFDWSHGSHYGLPVSHSEVDPSCPACVMEPCSRSLRSLHPWLKMFNSASTQPFHMQPDLVQGQIKTEVKAVKTLRLKQQIEELLPKLLSQLQHCIALGQEKGSSSWLTPLPIERHGYSLHKSDFKDAIALHYNLPLQRTPSHCVCGHKFSVEHAPSCPTGGYTAIRHNEVRDLTASMLQELCHDVQVEPHLQYLSDIVGDHQHRPNVKGHSLMPGFSTQLLNQIVPLLWSPPTTSTNWRRRDTMKTGSWKLNDPPLHLSSCLPLEVWDHLPQISTAA